MFTDRAVVSRVLCLLSLATLASCFGKPIKIKGSDAAVAGQQRDGSGAGGEVGPGDGPGPAADSNAIGPGAVVDTVADLPATADASDGIDALSATGGAGGTGGISGTGGVIGMDVGPGAVDVRPEAGDAPAADTPPDSPVGGSGGMGGTTTGGGMTATGGTTNMGGSPTTGGTTGSGGTTGPVLKTAGASCSATGECQTGLTCLDGVCCTQSTCPACQNCGATGTCSIMVSSADDTTGTTCTGTNTCGAAGTCKKKSGETCLAAGDCASGTCTDGHCCSQTCGVCQACTGAGGSCVAVISADDADSCTGQNTCNAAGACKKKNGQGCSAAGDCATGACTDGYCCSQTCGVCQACTGVGGTCVAVTGAEDPGTCSGTQYCDGGGTCKNKRPNGSGCVTNAECACGACGGGTCCAPSCVSLAAICGPNGSQSCCTSLPVTGGTFNRSNDVAYPATVADFYLDKYEITVGRFRQFVNASMGTQAKPPAAGAGAHPLIAGSGWDTAWNVNLPADTNALKAAVQCDLVFQTWTDTAAGGNENRPQNCLDWYMASAFCAWDGGRLATEAEWNYAAAGGSEQRVYPWGSSLDVSKASYDCSADVSCLIPVGSDPAGNGKWGQADLAGNVQEWTLDWYQIPYPTPCSNCAALTADSSRGQRGGDFDFDENFLQSASRAGNDPTLSNPHFGARCARDRL